MNSRTQARIAVLAVVAVMCAAAAADYVTRREFEVLKLRVGQLEVTCARLQAKVAAVPASGTATGALPPGSRPAVSPAGGLTQGRYSRVGAGHWVKEVVKGGAAVVLEDGSLWEVEGSASTQTALWRPRQGITVAPRATGQMPYTLINADTGQAVGAKLVGRR